MSLTGVEDVAAGSAIVDKVKHLLTPVYNKPERKDDLVKLVNHLSRYHRIKDLKPNIFGHFPYLDLETGNRVCLPEKSFKLK